MASVQRSRLLVAVIEVVEEVGYAEMTVGKVIGRARVSRKTFYDTFADRESCFLAAFEQVVARSRWLAEDAYAQQSGWRKGIRAALEAILILMEKQPGLARVCVVDALGAGPKVLRFRAELLNDVARVLDQARSDPAALRGPPAVTGETVAGGISSVLHRRLCEDRMGRVTDLLGPLMSMIMLPYLGIGPAEQELSRQRSALSREKGVPMLNLRSDPMQGLGIRLTYRTVRTLSAIAESPGASNRDVAERAGIVDQGQISKLLNRLAGLGLVENSGPGQSKGGPNAWLLTDRGERLYQAAWSR